MTDKRIVITDYLRYRVTTRGFDLGIVESVVRYSEQRYFDVQTRRRIVVGRHKGKTIVIPYEETEDSVTPVTVHAVTRRQIRFRVNTGRFTYE